MKINWCQASLMKVKRRARTYSRWLAINIIKNCHERLEMLCRYIDLLQKCLSLSEHESVTIETETKHEQGKTVLIKLAIVLIFGKNGCDVILGKLFIRKRFIHLHPSIYWKWRDAKSFAKTFFMNETITYYMAYSAWDICNSILNCITTS